ncbi:MAG: hypothetical protein JW958_04705 [Candidatus Eisenbacteria bacterium]|nr:hypothetical protein [Candidatus Eisenbacteria bacterium]
MGPDANLSRSESGARLEEKRGRDTERDERPPTGEAERLRNELEETRRTERRLRRHNHAWRLLYRKKKEDLLLVRARLEELRRLRNDFLTSVSHELRTPLTSILSSSEYLLNGDEPPPKSRHCLEMIRTEGERLNRIIDEIFEITRLGGEDLEWRDETIDMGRFVRGIVEKDLDKEGGDGAALRVEIESNVPRARADAKRLEAVLRYLLTRVRRVFSGGGEVRIVVGRMLWERGGESRPWVRVVIGNEGWGASAEGEYRPDVVSMEERGEEGWGLSVCRDVITHYGGDLWFEKAEGSAGRVVFTLPAVGEPLPNRDRAERDRSSGAVEGAVRPRR